MRTLRVVMLAVCLFTIFSLTSQAVTCNSPDPVCFTQNFNVPLPKEASGAFLGQVNNPSRLFLFVAVLVPGYDPDQNGISNYQCFDARGWFDADGDNVTALQDPNDLAEYATCGDLGDAFSISGRSASLPISGDPFSVPPNFGFPGWQGRGSGGLVSVQTNDPTRSGRFEGEARRSLQRNYGFPVQQKDQTLFCQSLGLCGSFVEEEVFRAFYNTDNTDPNGGGLVVSWGFSEISLRKQVK